MWTKNLDLWTTHLRLHSGLYGWMASAICHGIDLYHGPLTLRWSWPWPLNDCQKIPGQRSPQGQMSRSQGHYITRSFFYSTDILLFMALTFTLDIWPWDDLDLDLKWPLTFTKFQVIGQRSTQGQMSRSQGHCITLQISYCSRPWPLPWAFDLEMILTFKLPLTFSEFKVKGHLKVKCRGHKVIILQGHKVIVLLYRYLTVHGLDLYPGHLTLRWSWPWPWPLNDL